MNIKNRAGRLLIGTFAACVAGLAAPAWLRADVTVALTQTPALATVTNGLPVQVDAVVTTNAAEVVTGCDLVFRTLAEGTTNWWNTNAMSNVGAAAWRGFVPRLPEGTVEYYVDAHFSGGPARSATNTYAVSATLENRRVTDFTGWTQEGTSTNYYRTVPGSDGSDSNRWYASGAFIGLPGGAAGARPQYNPPTNAPSPHGYIRSIQDSYIRSPFLSEGAGTLYFIACKRVDDGIPATVAVQYTTNATPGSGWQTVQTLSYTNLTQQSWPVIINQRDARYVRLLRTDATYGAPSLTLSGAVVYDNLAISLPPADVLLTPLPIDPTEPVTQQVVTVSCDLSDANAYVPTINRRFNVVYQWNADAAVTLAMTNAAGSTFVAEIPGLDAGTNKYYFTCDFDGYFYKLDPDGTGVVTQRIERIGSRTSATNSYAIVSVVSRVPSFNPDPLAFGGVPISGWKTNALTVSNIGNAALTVTGISSTEPAFSVMPTNFTLAAFSSTNVTVTFAPSMLGAYTGKLIFVSNQTAGTNQVEVTGLGEEVEVVSVPTSIAGPVAGARTQSLSFTASGATNNYPARGVEYRFDWGVGDPETNLFGAATQAYAWQTISNAFPLRAQARSQTDPSKVSAWSGVLATVAITNTRIINVTGSLAFGNVVTNTSLQRILVVSNSVASSDALTVTNITSSMADITIITPTAFVLPAGASSNVTVTFTPLSLASYSGDVTVFSDRTSGAFTMPMSGTGIVVEAVSAPTGISPNPAAGARMELLSFTASGATNSHAPYGHGLQYRFYWGDNVTSAWGSATQAHAWSTIGDFNISAQARSLETPAIESPWSGVLASVTITNTRIINVTGNLAFGTVVINTTTTRTITVSNTGSEVLTVSDITCSAADVTISPKNFTLAAFGGSSNVVVTFTPLSTGGYAGTLTVHADQTSGANTLPLSATVIDVEVVNITSFSGPSNGATNENIIFSALAVNNYAVFGHGVQYRFDWGDSRTSAWSGASSASTNWAAVGTYAVSVQARCNLDTDTVVTAWYAPITLTIRPAPVVTFTPVDNGLPTPVTVTVAGATACTLFYSPAGATDFAPLPLVAAGGDNWTGTIPPINAGLMRYYVQYSISGPVVIVWPNAAPYPTHLISSAPGERRFTNFSGWLQDSNPPYSSSSTNYYRDVTGGGGTEPNRWYASGVFVGLPGGAVGVRPQLDGTNAPSPHGYIRSIQGSYIRSPYLSEGVGVLYFISCMRSDYTATIEIQITTNATPDSGWQTVATNQYSGTAQQSSPVAIHRRDARYVRLLRTDGTFGAPANTLSGAVVFDNISISIPPTEVMISERLRNPGYPARVQDVLVRCVVTDVATNFPSINRQVQCFYSWQSSTGPWTATNMTAQGNDLYHGIIPKHEIGLMYYYFRCDFDGYSYALDPDGTGGAQGTNKEVVAKGMLPANAPSATQPPYGIRRYLSIFSGMEVDTDPSSVRVATNDVTLVGDHTWQGLTLVKGITNLAWRFKGYDAYTNNAEAFDPIPWRLGDDDQDSLNPPIAGRIEFPGANDLLADLDYDGFLLFRVNTDPLFRDYIVKRAVYQNFDTPFWQASPNFFEESLGLYAMKSFPNDFNAWAADEYPNGDYRTSDLELLSSAVGQDYVAPPGYFAGAESWAYQSGKAIGERGYISPLVAPNTALTLNADRRGLVWNTSIGFTPGIQSFSFDARTSVEDTYFSLFTGESGNNPFVGSTWTSNYVVTANLRAQEMSPDEAYISTLVYYQPTYFGAGPGSFYEVRLIQDTDIDLAFSDNRVIVKVFRWNEGSTVPTEIANSVGAGLSTNAFDGQRLTTGTKSIEVKVDKYTVPGTTRLEVRLDWTGGATNWIANPIQFNDAGGLTAGGSVGFMTFDTVPVVSRVEVKTTNNVAMLPAVTNWSGDARWFMGGKRLDNQNRWQVHTSGALWRPLPTVYLGVYTAQSVNDLDQPNFSDLVPRQQVAGLTLVRTPVTVTLKEWSKLFVALQNCATNAAKSLNDLPIVVDNLRLTPWRARTRTIDQMGTAVYRDWTSWGQQFAWVDTEKSWAVMEGWVNTSSGSSGNEVQFERSRANPGLVQALVSPVLTNGIGSIAFNHRASNGQVVFAIERTASNGDQSDYNVGFPLQVVTNSSTTSAAFFLPIRELFTGRVRVRLLPQSDPYAILKIDDLLVRDYPPRDETTWQAYNVLITSTQTNRVWEGQTGFLNKGEDLGTAGSTNINTAGTEILYEHRPFIQSPKVGTGVGEISFWYRVWDTNAVGQVELKVAPELDSPEEQWSTITNFTFTNTDYQYYKIEPYDLQNKVLRIYGYTNGPNRVALDNILMTEPVRTGYEIRRVTLIPAQPLENQAVGVEVEIGRFIRNPSNIQVFVSYHATPTNVWGYTNWWTQADTAGSKRIELVEIAPRTYQTPGSVLIPAFPVDTPVQFVAWGTHADLTESAPKIFQPTNSFTNPAWYYPRNMNGLAGGLENGLGAQGWSPYYFVYSCAPGAVWVNEINYLRWIWPDDFEYIELTGPAQTLIEGWRIEAIDVDNYNHVLDSCTVTNGTRLPDDKDGWGFFVWGDPNTPNVDQTFEYPVDQNLPESAGIRLVRSMGAWEQRLAYGESRANLFPAGYLDIGYKPFDFEQDTLCLIGNGNAYTNFQWIRLVGSETRTPGARNTSQVLKPILPTFFTIFSVVGVNGSHSVSNAPIASIQVVSGGSTQIVYTADQWFRIADFRTNGVAVAAASNQVTYVWGVTNVLSDRSNNVTFAAATAAQVGIPLSVNPAWTKNYYATEAAAAADTSLATDYLLNLNPTIEYVIGLTFSSIAVNGANITNAVVLMDGATNLTTTINGKLKMQGKTSLTNAAWMDVSGAALNNASFINGTNVLGFTDTTNQFFQAVITPL